MAQGTWAAVCVLLVLALTPTAWADTEPIQAHPQSVQHVPDAQGSSLEGRTEFEPVYETNQPFQDFEVHFLISLPFTALYSYLAVVLVDTAVQGVFVPDLREADAWVIAGLAIGGSLAVALGSAGRVPDQTRPLENVRATRETPTGPEQTAYGRLELVRVTY